MRGIVDVCTLGILNIEYRTCRTHGKTEYIRVYRLVFARTLGRRSAGNGDRTRREFLSRFSVFVADFAIARARLFV